MTRFLKATALAAGLATAAMVAPAFADGTYAGPNGGTASWQGDCTGNAYRHGCHRSWTATGPEGNSYSGGSTVYRGPWYAGRSGHVAGPDAAAYRRAWRRW